MKPFEMLIDLTHRLFLPLAVCCAAQAARIYADDQIAFGPLAMQPILAGERKCVLLTEQEQGRILIAEANTNGILWEWKAVASKLPPEHVRWFGFPSDAKIVSGGECVLTCASNGGVALIRISDQQVLYYANAGENSNPHSVEMLPDGNIVSASSTGNYLALFKVDKTQLPGKIHNQVFLADAHNVVWDHKGQVLWSASDNQLKAFGYHGGPGDPQLREVKSISMPDSGAHDLFPVHGHNALWISTARHIYLYDIATEKFKETTTMFQSGIKSISSGPEGFPTILMRPKEKWWTDEVIDSDGRRIFHQNGMKIYKARWVLNNFFSYPESLGIGAPEKPR